MQIHIQWDPDPEEMGLNADGTPSAREVLLTENFVVVWVDQFGTPQYMTHGVFDTPEVDAIIESMPYR